MRNRITAAVGVLVPIIVTAIVELSKIVIALISTPSKKGDHDDTH